MKKRIFIAMHYLEIGGAETSLIGLLQAFDYSKYDIDLFLYSHQGDLMRFIPKQINLLPEVRSYRFIEKPIKETIMNGFLGIALGRVWAKVEAYYIAKKNHFTKPNNAIYHYIGANTVKFLPNINPNVEYDLAISYLHPLQILRDKVKAKKKVGWIHTDFSLFDTDFKAELKVWNSMDYIVSISESITRSFLSIYPSLAQKIRTIENILPVNYIASLMDAFDFKFPVHTKGINILSVGRFSYQKNFDNVPELCSLIRSKGINLYWYLIGYGSDEALIRSKIKEFGMDDYVIIMGKKENPYPYIKACDVYIQPSRYEGKSVVVREAQFLGKPVIITDYPSSGSQLRNGYDGLIVPMDNQGCALGIVNALNNKDLLKQITLNIRHNDYTNKNEINKIYALI